MSSTTTGTITQWSELRPSKFNNFNKGVQIDDVWYNFYTKDANYLNNIQIQFPAGTCVKVEYDETKGYKPIKSIAPGKPDDVQLTMTDDISKQKLDPKTTANILCKTIDDVIELLQGVKIKLQGG